jgi:hypothetical protein
MELSAGKACFKQDIYLAQRIFYGMSPCGGIDIVSITFQGT